LEKALLYAQCAIYTFDQEGPLQQHFLWLSS